MGYQNQSRNNIDIINKPSYEKNAPQDPHSITETDKSFLGLESKNLNILKKTIFQLSIKTLEKGCLDVITNGFSYEQVQDPNYELDESENARDAVNNSISRERLGDLRNVMYTLPIQTLKYIDSFVSLTDIVTRCYIETDSAYINQASNQFIYTNEATGKRMVYYGFVFADYEATQHNQDKNVDSNFDITNQHTPTHKKIYAKIPDGRRELLGIQPLMRKIDPSSKKIEYTALLKDKNVVFDSELVITTEYGSYDELFKTLFRVHANLLENMSEKLETSKFLHVKAPKEYFNLQPSEKNMYTEAFSKLMNGDNGGIITTDAYSITLQSTSESGTLEKTGLELLTNSIGFITGIPQSVLFGIQNKGWSGENQEDQLKYAFFLKMLAENFFLPIMQQFCKICQLKDWKKLEYKTDALIREKLNIFTTQVPEELKTPERLCYAGLLVDQLLGIDSEAKAKIKKQLVVDGGGEDSNKDSKENIKKKSNNSKNSQKSSQKNNK